jgi:hypothetical protein
MQIKAGKPERAFEGLPLYQTNKGIMHEALATSKIVFPIWR